MNATQRKRLEELRETISDALNAIEEIAHEERVKFDNLNESLQQTERNQKLNEDADTLDSVVGSLQEALDSLDSLDNIVAAL